jgi:hypothetical protein
MPHIKEQEDKFHLAGTVEWRDMTAEKWLRLVINHWHEFGPEHGLEELIHHADTFLKSQE